MGTERGMEELGKELTRELLIKGVRGEIKLPRYQADGLIEKFIRKKDDPFAVAREIAEKINRGLHVLDATLYIRLMAPDLPKEELKTLAIDVFIKAAAITIIEKLLGWEDKPMPKKEVKKLYVDGLASLVGYEKAKRIVTRGIKYYLTLLKKDKTENK